MKTVIVIAVAGLLIIAAGVVAWISTSVPPPVSEKPERKTAVAPSAPETTPETAVATDVSAPKADAPAPTPKVAVHKAVMPPEMPREPGWKINGYEVLDPMARIALSFVGSDPEADAYWIGAINDSALSTEERKDLIEDLNEDGFSDPHHPSAEDLPLILSRMQLIEQLAPHAMDSVNGDAFEEAYKDLKDMAAGKEPK